MGTAAYQHFSLKILILFIPDLPDTPEFRDKPAGLFRREMHGFFIKAVIDDHGLVLTHQLNDVPRSYNGAVKRVFSVFNRVLQNIGQFRALLFRPYTGCYHP